MKFLPCLIITSCFFTACQKTTTTTTTITQPKEKPPVVNAGPSQTITLPVDSVSVTGTITDTGSKVTAYLWSEVSGPNVPVIADEGSISTKIKGVVPGSYIFQLMAIDTAGLTGVDTLQVTVNPNPLDSTVVTLMPNNNPYEFQYIGNTGVDNSSGSGTLELGAEAWTEGGTVFVRSSFRFDLSAIPAATFKSARLTLYSNPTPGTANQINPNFGTSNAMYIQRINTSWDPSNTNWATQPTTDTAGEVLIPQTNVTTTLDLVNIDVTRLVNTMAASGNYGFMIRLQNEVIYNCRIYCSSKYSDATKHPKLVLVY